MSNYPFSFDNNTTLPPVSGSTQEDIAITALRSAVLAVETELGIVPAGIYPDVRTRLDILESRINFSVSPSIPNDGYVKSPLFLWNVPSSLILTISDGYGAPTENRLPGSLYMRGDGYANNELYVRRSDGYWYPVQSDLWVASGDLSGTYLHQTVIGIQGRPLNTTVGTTGAVQDGYFLMWNNSDGYWEPQTGFIAQGDLAPGPGSLYYGRTNQIVTRIQQRNISTDAPSDGYAFIWEATDGHWDSQALATVWHNSLTTGDGYVTRTNIRSNRLKQSPSQNAVGRVGMTNFGSSTLGIGGASADYASILGGDNNTVSGAFAAILGGAANTASDGYATILDGYNNVAAGRFSTVMNGTLNTVTINAIESFILDGYNNNVSGFNSFILDGYNNSLAPSYAGILNGQNNSIANVANTHAWIGFGSSNSITGAAATYSMILGGSGNTTGAQNVFIGNPTGASAQSNYDVIVSGLNNTIGTSSTFATILGGNTNVINNSSGFGFIGTGNNINATGLYATVLNSTGATVNGLHTMILNGNTNSVTATFSTIGNGNNNTISGNPSYATILDGYSNSITGSGGLIVDGYSNTISGIWSSVLNGNTNSIAGRNSTILNGANNTIDATSSESTVIVGENNIFTNSANTTAAGSGNTFTNATATFVIGTFNTVQAASSFINGTLNTLAPGTVNNRTFGSSNTYNAGSTVNFTVGNSNVYAPTTATSNNSVLGSNNTIDGYGNSLVVGQNNLITASYSMVLGQFGRTRMFGQQVHSNARFNAGKTGEAQWSRVILTGSGGPGAAFTLQLQDIAPTNMTFQDGYSYELRIRVLISSVGGSPVSNARFVFDVLMHQDGGILVIDNVNRALETQNGSSWTASVSGYSIGTPAIAAPSNNQFVIQVDQEQTPFIQGTPATRRAMATVEMMEMTRL